MSPLRWTCKSLRQLSAELAEKGHPVSRTVMGSCCGRRISACRPTARPEGGGHEDRDAQFLHINTSVTAALAAHQPAIPVDTKKKELVGNFRNNGREWRPQGSPEEVRVHDFLIRAFGGFTVIVMRRPTANAAPSAFQRGLPA